MPIISNTVFKGVADRLAFQAEKISAGIDAGKPAGGGLFFPRVTVGDDFDVENPLISPSHSLDDNMANFSGTEKTLLSNSFSSMISALNTHINNVGAASNITTMDTFLTTSGIDVAYQFDDAYFASQGSHLNAINVFGPQQQLARVGMTGSGTGTYTHLRTLGTGSGKRSDTNYCAAPFEVITETLIGANDLMLAIQLKKEDGSTEGKTVTVTNGTASGTGFNVGTPSTDMYIDVTNVLFAGGNNNDSVVIVNKLIRDIAL